MAKENLERDIPAQGEEEAAGEAGRLTEAMTPEEVAAQLLHRAKAVERLGIPEYNWWNEGLHGVARAGIATVFPQTIGMAATFDEELLGEIGDVISTEARGKYNAAIQEGDRDIYKGLTYWSPNINIFRDPRWGRGHETYGEDPYLTGRLGVAYIKGMQGNGKYLKVAACAKHFAVHSGPEAGRGSFNAEATPKDLQETYLPAFEAAVKEARVEGVMGAYNAVNGEPSCVNRYLLEETLRKNWGFDGYVVSDCWAIRNLHAKHHFTEDGPHSASLAIKRGCDINCGCTYENLLEGVRQGLVTEEEIRRSAYRAMRTRARLGMFAKDCEYDRIPYTVVNQPAHQEKALRAARESVVLLKNNGILPLKPQTGAIVGVIGPNAYSAAALYGNYNGDAANWITNLDGLRMIAEEEGMRVLYSRGCDLYRESVDSLAKPGKYESEAMAVAKASDIVVLCMGLDGTMEGESGDVGNPDASGDKENLLLPAVQRALCEKILSLGKTVIFVLNSGSCLDVSAYEKRADAILEAWYSGEKGGLALAEILFGRVCPSGKLPVTFYYNDQPMPAFTDYHMWGRTYKFVQTEPAYPFGYGLSYTSFSYRSLTLDTSPDCRGNLQGLVLVKNTGGMAGDVVTQIYLRYEGEAFEKPAYVLCDFMRCRLNPHEEIRLSLTVEKRQLETVLQNGDRVILPGAYTLFAGDHGPDKRSLDLTGQDVERFSFVL